MNISITAQIPYSLQIKKWFDKKITFSVNTLVTSENAKTSTNGTHLKFLTHSTVRRVCFINKCYLSIF